MKALQKRSVISPEMLDGKAFVESLLEAGLETGLLAETEHARIQYSLLELLAKRLEALYGKETSSVPDELAGEVFDSLLYTIGVFLKSAEDGDTALKLLKETEPWFLYQKGLRGETLTPDELLRFRRYFLWGESAAEIAEKENVTENNMRVRISRLRKKITTILKKK